MIKECCSLIGQKTQLTTPSQKSSLKLYFSLMIYAMQISQISIKSFQRCWWPKNSTLKNRWEIRYFISQTCKIVILTHAVKQSLCKRTFLSQNCWSTATLIITVSPSRKSIQPTTKRSFIVFYSIAMKIDQRRDNIYFRLIYILSFKTGNLLEKSQEELVYQCFKVLYSLSLLLFWFVVYSVWLKSKVKTSPKFWRTDLWFETPFKLHILYFKSRSITEILKLLSFSAPYQVLSFYSLGKISKRT